MTETAVSSITTGLILAATSASRQASTSSLVAPPTRTLFFVESLALPASLAFAALAGLAESLAGSEFLSLALALLRALGDFLQLEYIEIIGGEITAQITGAVEFQGTLDFRERHRRELAWHTIAELQLIVT